MVPTGEVWRVLRQCTHLALFVWQHERELGEYAEAVADIEKSPALRTKELGEALAAPTRLVFYTPELASEAAAVQALEASRDALLARTRPLLLALNRHGAGMATLARCPGLVSWLAGNTVDEAINEQGSALDLNEGAYWETYERRRQFEEQHGVTPERWLAAWRRGEIEDRGEAMWIYHHALALEGQPEGD